MSTGERRAVSLFEWCPRRFRTILEELRDELIGVPTVMGPTLRMPEEVCLQWVDPGVGAAERITRMVDGRHLAALHD